jgi:hypothetical protein
MAWNFFQRRTMTGVESRAGFLDRPVLAVLVISLALVVLGYGAVVVGLW